MRKKLSVLEILSEMSGDHDSEMCNLLKKRAQAPQKDGGKVLGAEIITLLESRYATHKEADNQGLSGHQE